MRVLFVAHSFPRYDGDAAGSFMLRLAHALTACRVEVRVVAPGAPGVPDHSNFDGIDVHRFRYAPRRMETLAYTGAMADDVRGSVHGKLALLGLLGAETRAVARHAREFRADVVNAHWWFPNGLAAALAAPTAGVPLVTTCHGSDLRLLLSNPVAAPLARFTFRRSAAVTCVSTWLADVASSFVRSRPIVAPMPIDCARFAPGGDRDPTRILFAGRLSGQKGAELAVRALAMMQQHATLNIAGQGPEASRILQVAQHLGVANRVTMLGAVTQNELASAYAHAAVLVMPSRDEGLGLVAAEAQLSETPVVAFASGGLTDVVENDETGFLVPTGDVPALARALDAVLADSALRDRLGRAGRTAALARFNPAAAAAQYAALYRSVAGGRAA